MLVDIAIAIALDDFQERSRGTAPLLLVAQGSRSLAVPSRAATASNGCRRPGSPCLTPMDEPIQVSINDFATDEQLEAEIEANYFMKSADLVPWIVSIPLATAVGAFFTGFFGKLGADAALSAFLRGHRSLFLRLLQDLGHHPLVRTFYLLDLDRLCAA